MLRTQKRVLYYIFTALPVDRGAGHLPPLLPPLHTHKKNRNALHVSICKFILPRAWLRASGKFISILVTEGIVAWASVCDLGRSGCDSAGRRRRLRTFFQQKNAPRRGWDFPGLRSGAISVQIPRDAFPERTSTMPARIRD